MLSRHSRADPDEVSDPDYCAQTTLLKAHCHHCKAPAFRQPPLFDVPAGSSDLPDGIARQFTAKWPGRCRGCDERTEIGELISVNDEGDYLCPDCV